MLKMKCSQCKEFIESSLLGEISEVHCPHCKETVPVQDVLVSSKGFTFHRSDLIKRLFRYKTLLNEVSKERQLLENDPRASRDSKQSLDNFLSSLKEVMAGARNSVRVEFAAPLAVRYKIGVEAYSASLVNLSMTGACIVVGATQEIPEKKNHIALQIALPGKSNPVVCRGQVSWTRGNEKDGYATWSIGVSFEKPDDAAFQEIWDYISSVTD